MASKKKYGLNPAEINRLKGDDLKRTYQRLRKQALNRAEKLRMAGYDEYEIAHPSFPSLRNIDKNIDPEGSYRTALNEVSLYLNQPRTNVGALKAQERQVELTLKRSGYDISKSQLREFGQFMESVRDQYGRYSYPSESAATIFEQGYKRRMTSKTLIGEFGRYLDDKDKIAKLADTLQGIDPGKTKSGKTKRLTARSLKEAYANDWGEDIDS